MIPVYLLFKSAPLSMSRLDEIDEFATIGQSNHVFRNISYASFQHLIRPTRSIWREQHRVEFEERRIRGEASLVQGRWIVVPHIARRSRDGFRS